MSFQLPKKIKKSRALSLVFLALILITSVTFSVTSLMGCEGSTGNNRNLPTTFTSNSAASSKNESSNNPVSRAKELHQNFNTASLTTKTGNKETSFLLAQKKTAANKNKLLHIMGSDTMVQLVTSWVEAYQTVSPSTVIAVSGGGSGNGIASLLNGTNDIAPASREIKPEESRLAKKRGISYSEITVARDAIAIIVNPNNPIKSLSLNQLALIYTGKVTSWHDLDNSLPDKKIIIFSRESSSGTYEYFQEYVLKKNDFALTARLIPSSSSIVDTVAQDDWGIGYVGLGFVQGAGKRIRAVPIKADAKSKPVEASVQSVVKGQYPISRALYLYVTNLARQRALPFITFCKSQKGQAIVQKAGFVPI